MFVVNQLHARGSLDRAFRTLHHTLHLALSSVEGWQRATRSEHFGERRDAAHSWALGTRDPPRAHEELGVKHTLAHGVLPIASMLGAAARRSSPHIQNKRGL